MDKHKFENWLRQPGIQTKLKPVRELQGVLLEMLSVLDRVCSENGLRYYLFYGTLLGAMRHDGFIPWDDDADIVMPREDYEKLLHLPKDRIPEGYFLQSPYSEKYGRFAFAKLRKNGTACICSAHRHIRMHQGIFVDIFPFDEPAKGCRWAMWVVPRLFERLTAFSCARLPGVLKVFIPLQIVWSALFPSSWFARMGNWVARLLSGRSGRYISTFCTIRDHSERIGWDVEMFDPPRRIAFENIKLNVPSNAESLLAQRYGDWERLPPEDKRIPVHSDGGIISIDQDYTKFV